MPPFARLVIATHNRNKAGEMVQILSPQFPEIEIKTLADYEGAPEPEEIGTTYAENAAIKSESAAAFTGEWSLADDAGLEIDALNGEPGLRSKRFEGEETPFPQKMARILELLKDVPEDKRTARFRCCIALSEPRATSHQPPPTKLFEATCEGRIALQPSGVGGFGYDPIFYLPELGCTMADLTAEQKHAISHRGKVLTILANYLRTL
jgi:XTP/dITP diphosphohydrolase